MRWNFLFAKLVLFFHFGSNFFCSVCSHHFVACVWWEKMNRDEVSFLSFIVRMFENVRFSKMIFHQTKTVRGKSVIFHILCKWIPRLFTVARLSFIYAHLNTTWFDENKSNDKRLNYFHVCYFASAAKQVCVTDSMIIQKLIAFDMIKLYDTIYIFQTFYFCFGSCFCASRNLVVRGFAFFRLAWKQIQIQTNRQIQCFLFSFSFVNSLNIGRDIMPNHKWKCREQSVFVMFQYLHFILYFVAVSGFAGFCFCCVIAVIRFSCFFRHY